MGISEPETNSTPCDFAIKIDEDVSTLFTITPL